MHEQHELPSVIQRYLVEPIVAFARPFRPIASARPTRDQFEREIEQENRLAGLHTGEIPPRWSPPGRPKN